MEFAGRERTLRPHQQRKGERQRQSFGLLRSLNGLEMLANLKLTKQRARLNSWVGGRHPIRLACIVLCSLLALFLSRNTIQADVAPASSEKGRGIELNLLPEGLDGIAVEIEPPAAATEPSKTRTKDPRLSGRTETTTSSVTTENTITNKLPPLTTTAKVLSSALVTDNLVRVVATTKKPVVQGPAAAPTYEASTPSGGYQFSGRATWYNPCELEMGKVSFWQGRRLT